MDPGTGALILSAITAGGLLWKEVSAYLIRRRELSGQERSKATEDKRQDDTNAYARMSAIMTRLEDELKECHKRGVTMQGKMEQMDEKHQTDMNQLRQEHRRQDREAWSEIRRIQAKNAQLEQDALGVKQIATTNALGLSSLRHEVKVVKRQSGLHLDEGQPGESADPTHIPPIIGEP